MSDAQVRVTSWQADEKGVPSPHNSTFHLGFTEERHKEAAPIATTNEYIEALKQAERAVAQTATLERRCMELETEKAKAARYIEQLEKVAAQHGAEIDVLRQRILALTSGNAYHHQLAERRKLRIRTLLEECAVLTDMYQSLLHEKRLHLRIADRVRKFFLPFVNRSA